MPTLPTITLPPKLHRFANWLLAIAGLILSAREDLPAALAFLPTESKASKYIGWVLTLAAFSRLLGARAGVIPSADVPAPAAPISVIPASEAITAVDKPGVAPKAK